eukprot:763583-Hanusia_phi.AAC.9
MNFYTSPPKPWWQHGTGFVAENGDPMDATRSNSPMLVPVRAGDLAAAAESSEASGGWGSSTFAQKTSKERGRARDQQRGRDHVLDGVGMHGDRESDGEVGRTTERSGDSLWSDMRALLKDTLRMERDKDEYSKARKEEAERLGLTTSFRRIINRLGTRQDSDGID